MKLVDKILQTFSYASSFFFFLYQFQMKLEAVTLLKIMSVEAVVTSKMHFQVSCLPWN